MAPPKMPSPQFELATIEVEKINGELSNDELLELYALFKIATGEDFASAKQPGTFDFAGKYKYNAWKKQVDDGVGVGAAAQKYVAKVEEFKKSKGYDAKRTTRANGKAIEADKLKRYNELKK